MLLYALYTHVSYFYLIQSIFEGRGHFFSSQIRLQSHFTKVAHNGLCIAMNRFLLCTIRVCVNYYIYLRVNHNKILQLCYLQLHTYIPMFILLYLYLIGTHKGPVHILFFIIMSKVVRQVARQVSQVLYTFNLFWAQPSQIWELEAPVFFKPHQKSTFILMSSLREHINSYQWRTAPRQAQNKLDVYNTQLTYLAACLTTSLIK